LLAKLSPGEVDAVLAHELGTSSTGTSSSASSLFAMSLLGFALLGWLSTQAWFYTGLGVAQHGRAQRRAGAAAVPAGGAGVHLLCVAPVRAAVAPHEFQADAFAVTQTSGQDLSTALLKLYEDNASTLTPDPVFVKFYYSHPPASERLARMTA
jgi:STE24 endopeptidase